MGESYSNVPGYLSARGTAVRKQLAAQIPFEIQSNDGLDFTFDLPSVTLQGRGWIDVHRISRTGQSNALPVLWLDNEHWQTSLPLDRGTNWIELQAYNFRGVQVGRDSISITTTVGAFPQRDYLRVTELMFH